jgi:hypothetical protein
MATYPGYWQGYYFDYNEETDKDITISLTFTQFDLHQVKNGQIKGKGTDDQGAMEIWGNFDGENLSFTKKNDKKTLYFKGKRDTENNSVRGKWAKEAANL